MTFEQIFDNADYIATLAVDKKTADVTCHIMRHNTDHTSIEMLTMFRGDAAPSNWHGSRPFEDTSRAPIAAINTFEWAFSPIARDTVAATTRLSSAMYDHTTDYKDMYAQFKILMNSSPDTAELTRFLLTAMSKIKALNDRIDRLNIMIREKDRVVQQKNFHLVGYVNLLERVNFLKPELRASLLEGMM